jgi:D-glycero-D-manno-heptose 1,7-bisphosphate phosphatase
VSEKKIVVLDRDGVINQDSDDYIKNADEWIPIPGSIEAIARLKNAGYQVAVATNQSGIGRGFYSERVLHEMHKKLHDLLATYTDGEIDLIVYCPHRPDDGCSCRKPKSGLLDQIAEQLQVDLESCWMIGDSLKDLQVALTHKMRPVLVRTGKGRLTEEKGGLPKNTLIFEDLSAAVVQLTV